MLIELSVENKPAKRFWETVDKRSPIYAISDSEIKKANVQYSIGIVEPRVHVSKVCAKMNYIKNVIFLNNRKAMKLYKDDEGFYLKEIDW